VQGHPGHQCTALRAVASLVVVLCTAAVCMLAAEEAHSSVPSWLPMPEQGLKSCHAPQRPARITTRRLRHHTMQHTLTPDNFANIQRSFALHLHHGNCLLGVECGAHMFLSIPPSVELLCKTNSSQIVGLARLYITASTYYLSSLPGPCQGC
jgi:hypothetical protein